MVSIYEKAILIFCAECIIISISVLREGYRIMFSALLIHMAAMKNMGYLYACGHICGSI